MYVGCSGNAAFSPPSSLLIQSDPPSADLEAMTSWTRLARWPWQSGSRWMRIHLQTSVASFCQHKPHFLSTVLFFPLMSPALLRFKQLAIFHTDWSLPPGWWGLMWQRRQLWDRVWSGLSWHLNVMAPSLPEGGGDGWVFASTKSWDRQKIPSIAAVWSTQYDAAFTGRIRSQADRRSFLLKTMWMVWERVCFRKDVHEVIKCKTFSLSAWEICQC